MATTFEEWLKEEDLENFKHKASLRMGWDGRQEEIDQLKESGRRINKVSMDNLEKWEESRRQVIELERKIAEDNELVRKAKLHKDLMNDFKEENEKLNNMLANLAGEIAQLTVDNKYKDGIIQDLKAN